MFLCLTLPINNKPLFYAMLNFFKKKKNYKHIFFDLDRTLWDFDRNMTLTLEELYSRHNLAPYFLNFETFHKTFIKHNERLWSEYMNGRLPKDILRTKRFELTLKDFNLKNWDLAQVIGEEYIAESPLKTALLPYAREILEKLQPKYKLYIITNGFNEVQFNKLKLCGLEQFFTRVITSEISGYHKPHPQAFAYPLSSANALKEESIMVGDDLAIDILGARSFGIDQVFLNTKQEQHSEHITHEVTTLLELEKIFLVN